jgi:hypothetical protein
VLINVPPRSVALQSIADSDILTSVTPDVPVVLEWNAPPGEQCPSGDEVLRQVASLVGASSSRERPSIRARADVRKLGDDRFRVDLTTLSDGAEGHREIEERSCRAMAEATAVILAWMVDPDAVGGPDGAPEPQPKGAASLPEQKPGAVERTESAPKDEGGVSAAPRKGAHATKLVVGVYGAFDSSTLPAFAAGVGAELGARWSSFRVLARGALWAHQTAYVVQGTRAAGAELGLATIGVDACVAPWRWDIAPCAGPELDRMQGTGFGVDKPRTDSASWISVGFGVEGRAALVGPLGVTLGLRLVLPTHRETFGLDGVGNVHRVGALTARGAIGLQALF